MRRPKHRVTVTTLGGIEIRCSTCGWEANHPFEGSRADARLQAELHEQRAAIDEAEAERIARETGLV